MTAVVVGMALAQLIVSLHVDAHGGSYWKWMLHFWVSAVSIALGLKLLNMWIVG